MDLYEVKEIINYKIQKLQFKKVVRPIISKTPNERWSMD
jgi:hypothetical protein